MTELRVAAGQAAYVLMDRQSTPLRGLRSWR